MKATLLLETSDDGYIIPIGAYSKKEDAYEVQRRWYCLGSKQLTHKIESIMIDLDSTDTIAEMEEEEAWWQKFTEGARL